MNASIKYGAALVAALAMFGAAAQAAPISTNPTIQSGNYTFSNFTIAVTSQGSALPTTGAGNAVDVSGLSGANGIQISSGFTAVGASSFSDAAISYVVTGTAGLTSVGLSFDGTFLGLAISSVTETIYADAARQNLVGQNYVSCSIDGCSRTASISLNGSYDTLYVTKDINVSSFQAGDRAQTSVITQTYGPTAVPEPMSIALFGTGLVGLGLVRRARKAAK
ncbi:PEP-CTERM sorting domain-containing protein [Roseomonas haemaphysalidis]|uniref:PEP-CTERM sorting domain-containing protein n=1 Tax=Roseomonas haemaphysalidis TaxID=2768162 RepID=A0ABS3KJC2_9PROT|nr:PEP-CTERM sorting domain-containing protein [Roseomonas haemaphysalidis]MBO1077566.1 PEP-CTERM sorting domain-containing protein [Roseomonas haemaphysalidis]